jgi:signal transduction histidine kinase
MDNQSLASALEAAGVGIWEFAVDDHSFFYDSRCAAILSIPTDREAFERAVNQTRAPQQDGKFEFTFPLPDAGRRLYVSGGSSSGGKRISGIAHTLPQLAEKTTKFTESEALFQNIIEQSPMAIGLLTGPDLVLEVGNQAIFELWGRDESATGKRLIDFLPEIKGQGFIELLEGVYNTGIPFFGNAALARLERNGVLEDAYFNFSYTPWRRNGRVTGVIVLAVEVTILIRTQQALESSEARLRAVISGAPAAMALFTGRDLIVEMPNQAFIDIAAQGREIVGMPLREAMPELVDQPFLQLLDDVYTSGKTYEGFGVPGDIIQDGKVTRHYFNFSYSPLFDAEGKVNAILDITVDVTKLVETQRQMQEADSLMRGAVELAGLGVWSINGLAGQLTYSDRMYEWCGVDPKGGHAAGNFSQVDELDRARVEAAIVRAFDPASDGSFDEEFTVVHGVSQRKRILHAIGKVLPDEAGRPAKIIGTAQDITVHRQVQMALEQQIQDRTEELDASNEELQAANEELAVTNEELAQSNEDLISSNEDLQQFAHVTSHDLKEPLRKMRTFLSRIVEDPGTTFSAKSSNYIERMNVSAARMSEMIEGILKYSTINAGNQLIQVVDLNAVLRDVAVDLEMIIAQKRATVTCDELPVLQGAGILLYQLFYNLVINALKFSAEGVAPVIRISATGVVRNGVPHASIEVRDNGIGFGQENALLIFNTFTRLHTKDRYEGTGLGLALCKKIVHRHHGTILAEGRPGEGAVFIVELPVQQPKPAV